MGMTTWDWLARRAIEDRFADKHRPLPDDPALKQGQAGDNAMARREVDGLVGSALWWALAKAEEPPAGYKPWVQSRLASGDVSAMGIDVFEILLKRRMSLAPAAGGGWIASVESDGSQIQGKGHDAAVAIARCRIRSVLGDSVAIPAELQ